MIRLGIIKTLKKPIRPSQITQGRDGGRDALFFFFFRRQLGPSDVVMEDDDSWKEWNKTAFLVLRDLVSRCPIKACSRLPVGVH